MNKNALIVFAKNPLPGKVKTRLAKSTGDKFALKIYKRMLENSYLVTKSLKCKKYLFLSEKRNNTLFDDSFEQLLQSGNDLGERMKNAFSKILKKGFTNIVLIGTDCPGLDSKILNSAFEKLKEHDIVIGPAFDGGYYLIGMKQNNFFIFENMKWGTEKVFEQTILKLILYKKKYALLKTLVDIDEESDLSFYDLS